MTAYETVHAMIEAGEFRNTSPYYPTVVRYRTFEEQTMTDAYRAVEKELVARFRAACEKAFGVKGNVADLLWEKAWKHGHANGYTEVLYWYDEFAEFLRV